MKTDTLALSGADTISLISNLSTMLSAEFDHCSR